MPSATKNLHVPLPVGLYQRLRKAADKQRRPATQVAREAITLWLRHEKRKSEEDDLRRYVAAMAGTEDDLDLELEAASVEHLTKRRKR